MTLLALPSPPLPSLSREGHGVGERLMRLDAAAGASTEAGALASLATHPSIPSLKREGRQ